MAPPQHKQQHDQSPSASQTRRMPRELAAERAVLAALFHAPPGALRAVRALLAPRDFSSPVHRAVFAAVVDLNVRGEPIDVVTVRDEMVQHGTYGRIAPAFLRALADLAAAVAAAPPPRVSAGAQEAEGGPPVAYCLAWIVKKKAILRRVACANQAEAATTNLPPGSGGSDESAVPWRDQKEKGQACDHGNHSCR